MNKQVRRKIETISCDVVRLFGKKTDYGEECNFFKMSKHSKYGIKAYSTWKNAEDAWRLQKKAAKLGLAPGVGKILIIKYKREGYNDEKTLFGYETKVAEKVKNGFKNQIWKDQHRELEEKLIAIGSGGDFCPRNCGIIKNKLVAIDFGTHSKTS